MKCICSHKLFNWKVISEKKTEYLTPNDYIDVTNVHEDYTKFRKGRKHKKCRKTKKLVFQKNR